MHDSHTADRIAMTALVVTHQHEKFIEAALDSVARQRLGVDTPGEIEVVVADDDSSDGTLERIRVWSESNGRSVRILPPRARLGITRNYQRAFAECRGDYIAVLEGDDEWVGDDRLALAVRRLDADDTLAMLAFYVEMVDEGSGEVTMLPDANPPVDARRLTLDDLAHGNLFSTFSACVYRRRAIDAIEPRVYDLLAYDWLVNMSVTKSGDALLLPDVRTRYRRHAGGVWSRKTQRERDEQVRDILPGYISLFEPPARDSLEAIHAWLVSTLGPTPEPAPAHSPETTPSTEATGPA